MNNIPNTQTRIWLEERYKKLIADKFNMENDNFGVMLSHLVPDSHAGREYIHCDLANVIMDSRFEPWYEEMSKTIGDTWKIGSTKKKVKRWIREEVENIVYQAKLLEQYPSTESERITIERIVGKKQRKTFSDL